MKRKLIYWVCAMSLLLTFVLVQTPAKADTSPFSAKVIAAQLRVRDRDSLKGKVVGIVKRGQIVSVLGTDRFMLWVKIQTDDGVTGWVSIFWVKFMGVNVKAKDLPRLAS